MKETDETSTEPISLKWIWSAIFIVIFIFYAGFSFTQLILNPLEWSYNQRCLFAAVTTVCLFVGILVTLGEKL